MSAASAYVAELEKGLSALSAKAEGLRTDLKAAEKSRRAATRVNVALLGLVALFVGMLTAIGWQVNQGIEANRETSRRIADCTTAGGSCYEEGRKRGEAAIGALTKISIYVSQCGRLYPGESGPEYDRKIELCVAERLRLATPSPSASPSG